MNLPTETPETAVCCENCPAVQRLERALEKLRGDFQREVGCWKSRHAAAVQRLDPLKEELHQSRGQVRALQDKLFGRKPEKSGSSDRSNELFDPEEAAVAGNKRDAQPGHAGHRRRDYSHLPVVEEFVSLPEESLVGPHCGKRAAMMSDTEDSELLEIDVRAHRRRIRRRRYRPTCDCDGRARRRPKTSDRFCPGISLPNAVRRWPCEPRLPPPPTPHDVADHRPCTPTFPRHPLAGVNLLLGNSLR